VDSKYRDGIIEFDKCLLAGGTAETCRSKATVGEDAETKGLDAAVKQGVEWVMVGAGSGVVACGILTEGIGESVCAPAAIGTMQFTVVIAGGVLTYDACRTEDTAGCYGGVATFALGGIEFRRGEPGQAAYNAVRTKSQVAWNATKSAASSVRTVTSEGWRRLNSGASSGWGLW
jgi:hypothetical protein